MPKNVKQVQPKNKQLAAKNESSKAIKKAKKEKVEAIVSVSTKSSKEEDEWMNLEYNAGFGNHFESEARVGALPKG